MTGVLLLGGEDKERTSILVRIERKIRTKMSFDVKKLIIVL